METTKQENKWYQKTWLVILLCILFFPVGLYGLWKSSNISKSWKIIGTIIIGIVFISIKNFNNNSNSATSTKTVINQSSDTTYYFVKRILNSTPKEVSIQLGNPDNGVKNTNQYVDEFGKECTHATYQNKKYDAIYYKNFLKQLIIYPMAIPFDTTAIQYIGFPKCKPSCKTQLLIAWRGLTFKGGIAGEPLIPIKGIEEINDDAGSSNGMCIVVEANYNKKF